MGEQLSLKAAMPLAEILATCRKNVSNTGPCSWTQFWLALSHQLTNVTRMFKHLALSVTPTQLPYVIIITSNCSIVWWHRDPYVHAPSQWETTLHCKVASRWLGAYTNWSLMTYMCPHRQLLWAQHNWPGYHKVWPDHHLLATAACKFVYTS